MSERETREFITPGNHKVVLYTYLSGRESNEVEAIMKRALTIDPSKTEISPDGNAKPSIKELTGDFLVKQEEKVISLLLVSLDGDTNAPMERLLDLPASELAAVKAEVEKITNPTTPQNSVQPGSGTSEAA
jgi:hypothetical protein